MQKSERSSYTAIDFADWQENGSLEISPRFQRRRVWTRAARSYLIDTLIMGYPVPPMYLRVLDRRSDGRQVREVVDGQQRISTVLDFMEDKFSLSSNIESEHRSKYFSELPNRARSAIAHYPFICEVFYGLSDREVLSIFARLNTYSVKLNAQELRNGKFFGPFKRLAYDLALQHLNFWRQNRLFSEQAIARMQEVELTSELIIAMLDGMQDKKKSIDDFYRQFDDEFPHSERIERQFQDSIDVISQAFPETLQDLQFRRVPLFYSLFGVVAHRLFGLPEEQLPRRNGSIRKVEIERLSDAGRELSAAVEDARAGESVGRDLLPFVTASLQQTDNLRPRQVRFRTLYLRAFGYGGFTLPRPLPALSTEFKVTCLRLLELPRRLELNYKTVKSGTAAISRTNLELAYELVYLKAFLAWENFLESVFVRLLCGYSGPNGPEPMQGGIPYFRSADAAYLALIGNRGYVLWHNRDQVIQRFDETFNSPDSPFTSALINSQRLEAYSSIRHRIAHGQGHAKQQFDDATNLIAAKRYRGSRAGEFLRDQDVTAPGRPRYISIIFQDLGSIADRIN